MVFTLIASFVGFTAFTSGYKKIPQIKEKDNASNILGALEVDTTTPQKNLAGQFSYFTKDTKKKPLVSAEAYFVGDLETGEIIIEMNSNKPFPIASVSKLMTASVAQENFKEDELIVVSQKALNTEGYNGNFKVNERVKQADILYPLLLESSNDGAEAIAMHAGRETFLEKMNRKAKDLGLADTSFADPSGLSSQNISTTNDLFKLAKYIKEIQPTIFELTTNRSFKNTAHTWFSTNQFLKEPGYLGGKSGYTDPARQTVVSLFELPLGKDGTRPIGITLLRSNDRKKDVQNILAYLKKNIFYGTIADASEGWVSQKFGVAEPKDPDFVNLAFLGDLMLDRGVRNSVNKNFNGDYSALFEKLEILNKSDIVFANLEGTASDKGKDMGNLYSFHMDPSVVPALRGAGIDIVSMANNHVGDWGVVSYADTLRRLKENEIAYTGGGFNLAEATEPTIVEQYGIKIGYLGFSDVGPNWMGATVDSAGLLLANNPNFDQIIRDASAQVDHLVVSFHWGDEYKKIHNARQESLAHRAVDAGAKLVIGHHPHVTQDTEVYKNSFIAYSLGNAIFDQGFSTDTMQGMLLEIKLSKDGSMTSKKNTVKLNRVFQPSGVIEGKEEKIKFETSTISQ